MKILVLGGSGLVGSEIKKVFSDDEVLCPTRKDLDVRMSHWVNEYVFGHKPGVVINAAAVSNVDGCEDDSMECMDVNAFMPGELARMSAGHGFKLVHISSDYVFSGNDRSWYGEQDKVNPISVYGESKAEAERRIEFVRKHLKTNSLIVRTSWVFGRGRDTFVEYFLKQLADPAKPVVEVVSDQVSTPTFAKDLAMAIKQFIANDTKGVAHFANQGDTSKYLMMISAAMIANQLVGKDIFDGKKLKPISMLAMSSWKAKRPQFSPLRCGVYEDSFRPMQRGWRDALQEHLGDILETKLKGMCDDGSIKV